MANIDDRNNLISEISNLASRLTELVGSITGVDFESINKAAYASNMILEATDMISQIKDTSQDEREKLFAAMGIFKNVAGIIKPYMGKVDEAMKTSTEPTQYEEVVKDVNELTSQVNNMEPSQSGLDQGKTRTLQPRFMNNVQVV